MAILRERFLQAAEQDLDTVLKSLHLKEESYERVLKISVMTTGQSLLELAAALGSEDRLKAQKIAHDLKGVFGNLRIEPLSRLAVEIECLAKESTGSIWESYESFSAKFEALKNVFQKEGEVHVENTGR